MFNIEKAQVKNVASQNYEVHHNLRVVKVRKQKKLCPNHRTQIERFECQWGYSSAGRALPLQGRCRRFDPGYLHHFMSLGELITRESLSSENLVRGHTYADLAQLVEQLTCNQ